MLNGHVSTPTPRSHLGSVGIGFKEEEKEELSDADEPGLKRVDISDVRGLDWMAPEALRKVREVKRKNIKLKQREMSGKLIFSSPLGNNELFRHECCTTVKSEPPNQDAMQVDSKSNTPDEAIEISDDDSEEHLENIAADFVPPALSEQSDVSPLRYPAHPFEI